MKNISIILLTAVIIGALNWVASLLLDMSFLDISIPVGGIALILIYFVTNKGGMASRQMDMSIQGQTGIRMEHKAPVSERSYVLIGSIMYVAVMLVVSFIAYREYFLGIGI
ncbi:hypothetical protein [Planomicrobium okeanokoites]|uniref:hypothetical protein n=1 Tax=Planomicrobium okeanokoites TaxID=244 RepID=UPI000A03793D|nr:hypothetical protein [Planomicrobium okeanokoites]